jgi:hypothetical protein
MSDSVYSEGTTFADEIHRDLAAVRAFGSENPGVLVDLKISHEPATHVVVLLTAGTQSESISTLRKRLKHGDQFEVEFTSITPEELEAANEEIQEFIREHWPHTFRQYGVQWGQVHVTLRPDHLQLADVLLQRYGNLVRLEVGRKPYPPQPHSARDERPQRPGPTMPEITIPGLEVTLILDQPTISSGSDGHAHVRFENVGEDSITIQTGSPLTAHLLDPATHDTTGHFDGAIAGVGINLHLQPGDVKTIPVIFGTASPADVENYSTRPGHYVVECHVEVYGEPGANGVPSVSILRVGTADIEVTETPS